MANGNAPNISDPTQYAGPPTQGNAPAQPAPSGGFMGILKNKILPAVGPIAARLGAVYGNPMGLEEEYRQKQLQMQQTMFGPQVQRAQAEATLAGKQAAVQPGSEEEALQHFRSQMGIERSMTPATGTDEGGLPQQFTISPTGPGGALEGTPIPIRNAQTSPTQTPDPFAAMSGTGSAQPSPPPPFDPRTIGALPPFANTVPTPIGAAAETKTKTAPQQFMRPPVGGGRFRGSPTRDPDTGQWYIPEYYGTMMGSREIARIPTETPSAFLPPKNLWGYLSDPAHPEKATGEDIANAARAYNTRESSNTGVRMVPQPDGTIREVPVTTTTTTSRGAPPALSAPTPPPTTTSGVTPRAAVTSTNVPLAPPPTGPNAPKLPDAGRIVGGKSLPSVEKAYGDYNSALQRQETMHNNYNDAIKSGGTNQQAEVSLLFNHIGMTQGAQKGARQTQTIVEEAERSAPFIKNFLAKYFDFDPKSKEYILNTSGLDIKGGINLNPEQMKQMVDLGDQMVIAKQQEFQREQNAAHQGYGMFTPGGPTMPVQPPPIINNAANPNAAQAQKPQRQIHFTPIR
jgi:hypothetical protein